MSTSVAHHVVVIFFWKSEAYETCCHRRHIFQKKLPKSPYSLPRHSFNRNGSRVSRSSSAVQQSTYTHTGWRRSPQAAVRDTPLTIFYCIRQKERKKVYISKKKLRRMTPEEQQSFGTLLLRLVNSKFLWCYYSLDVTQNSTNLKLSDCDEDFSSFDFGFPRVSLTDWAWWGL